MAGTLPTLPIPGYLPRTKEAPVQDIAPTAPAPGTEPTRSPEEEGARLRLKVCELRYGEWNLMVNQYESTIQEVHKAARIHTQMSKGTAGSTADYRPQGGELPVISLELTFELLHCLSTPPAHGYWPRSL